MDLKGRYDVINQIKDDQMKIVLFELTELLHQVYGKQLKTVILYGPSCKYRMEQGEENLLRRTIKCICGKEVS